MNRTLFSPGKLILLSFLIALVLVTGCAQQKVFDFSAPASHVKAVPKSLSTDSVQPVSVKPEAFGPTVSKETYPLEASTAQAVPAIVTAGYTTSSIAVSTQAASTPKEGKAERQLLPSRERAGKLKTQDLASAALPLPFHSKAALVLLSISLIALGVALMAGSNIGVIILSLCISIGTFIPAIVTSLKGKRKAILEPEKYNVSGAKNVSLLVLLLMLMGSIILIAA